MLYKPPQFLQPLQEKEKRVKFAGHEWIIQQNWDSVGVAAVVWEPVGRTLAHYEQKGLVHNPILRHFNICTLYVDTYVPQ